MLKIGIIQHGPVYLDAKASLSKLQSLIEVAAHQGAQIVACGESWLSGYPAWIDHCPEIAKWDYKPGKQVFARMYENSITIPGQETETLGKLAQKYHLSIVLGVNERVNRGPGNGTIYNSLIIIGPDGSLLNHHRKLMPTYTEKMMYGLGDARGLKTVDTHDIQLGALICWEHWMPLARQQMHNQGEHIHIAVWPTVHEIHQIASRHYAFEGRCFVIAVGQIMRVTDIPEELNLPTYLRAQPDTLLLKGGSCIIGPDGQYILEPQMEKEEVFVREVDPRKVIEERMTLDVTGHYQRLDVFNFGLR